MVGRIRMVISGSLKKRQVQTSVIPKKTNFEPFQPFRPGSDPHIRPASRAVPLGTPSHFFLFRYDGTEPPRPSPFHHTFYHPSLSSSHLGLPDNVHVWTTDILPGPFPSRSPFLAPTNDAHGRHNHHNDDASTLDPPSHNLFGLSLALDSALHGPSHCDLVLGPVHVPGLYPPSPFPLDVRVHAPVPFPGHDLHPDAHVQVPSSSCWLSNHHPQTQLLADAPAIGHIRPL